MLLGRRYNHSVLFQHDGEVRKLLEPESLFTKQEAEVLATAVTAYQRALTEAGVPTPPSYRVDIDPADDYFQVVEWATNMGDNCEVIMTQGGLTEDVVARILSSLVGVLQNSDLGIDAYAANWCLRGNQFAYVDFHPARLLLQGRYLVGFPQPSSYREVAYSRERYYSPLGIIRILRFNLIRSCGHQVEQILQRLMRNLLPSELSREIESGFEQLPERMLGRIPFPELLESLSIWHVDDIREIAMRLDGAIGAGLVTQVLKLTTGDFRIPESVRIQRFDEAKRVLREYSAKQL